VLGLELGAADYLTKPFDPRELAARVRARLRETRTENPKIRAGALEIDCVTRGVSFRGKPIELVKKEFELLALLAEAPGKVFSRDEILNKVWGYEVFPSTRTVDTHVMLLRQKLDGDLIETVRAVGYRFVLPN
jgi:DNA-binding response OmpR family regulator